jgi:ADP-ribose pyrophosphatase YjhB (NUDIX family)
LSQDNIGPREHIVPDGDDRERLHCPDCGYIAYENPRVVVGAVPRHGDRILLCRRAIPPAYGYWTMPAGYLELHETTEHGAERESWEEARARLELGPILAVFSITHINQVQIIYRARLLDPAVAAGPESLEVALFEWSEIPWDELAFPTVRWALEAERRAPETGPTEPAGNPATESPGLK